MRRGVLLTFGSLLAAFFLSSPVKADDVPRLLFVTQSVGFKHGSVTRPEKADKDKLAPAEVAVIELGQKSKLFKADVTQNVAADFTKENLKNYRLVMFYTTGNLGIPEETLKYFLNDWLKQKGNGFIGVHSSTDTYGDYQPYWDMVGGTFNGHPWNAGDTVTISVHDPDHAAVKAFGKEFEFKDEIYQYKNWQPGKVRVLMSLNMAKTSIKKPYHVPVSWVKEYGQGRVFYTNLGHNVETWTNPRFIEHLKSGIEWTLHKAPGSAEPNPDVSAAQEEKAKKDAR
jgi:type 1 glutamine amidotransferase